MSHAATLLVELPAEYMRRIRAARYLAGLTREGRPRLRVPYADLTGWTPAEKRARRNAQQRAAMARARRSTCNFQPATC